MSELISQEQYPWITFKLRGKNYCISSKTVYTMMMPEQFHPLPESDPGMLGLMTVGKEPAPVISVRTLLGMPLLQEDLDKFGEIKQKHLNWIEGLKSCMASGSDFLFPIGVHECELGLWHDNFHTDNYNLKRFSEQLGEPHVRLHERTHKLLEQRALGTSMQNTPLFREILTISEREIVPILEKLDRAYRDTNRGIIVVLEQNGQKAGIQVDRVMAVSSFEGAQRKPRGEIGFGGAHFVRNVIVENGGQLYLELDVDAVVGVLPTK